MVSIPGMEGKERPLTHIFKKIEGPVILVFQRKIPCRISRLDYLLRPHSSPTLFILSFI